MAATSVSARDRALLLLSDPPRPEPEAVRAIARVLSATAWDVRQRLAKPGTTLLRASADPAELEPLAASLRGLGFAATVLPADALEPPEPLRAVRVEVRGRRVLLLGRPDRGDVLTASLQEGQRALLLLGDLAIDPRGLVDASGRWTIDPDEDARIASLCRGAAALRLFVEGESRSTLVLSDRFDLSSVPDSSASRARNMIGLLDSLRGSGADLHVDLDFGIADTCAPLSYPSVLDGDPRLPRFDAHCATAHALWLRGALRPARFDVGGSPRPAALPREILAQIEPVPSAPRWQRVRDAAVRVLPGVLTAAAFAVTAPPSTPVHLQPIVGGGLGAVLLWEGLRALNRVRALRDHPPAKVRSMPMGRVELQGFARAAMPLRTPFCQMPCVWFDFTVEALEQDGQGNRTWRTIGRGSSGALPFFLEDATGRALVQPAHAEMLPVSSARRPLLPSVANVRDDTRVIERWLDEGAPIFVFGFAQPMRAGNDELASALRERLRTLKAHPERLAAFDRDRDGRIDAIEWDDAVASVERELAEERLLAVEAGVSIVGRDPHGGVFLISGRSERELIGRMRPRAAASIMGGLVLLAGSAWLLAKFGGSL